MYKDEFDSAKRGALWSQLPGLDGIGTGLLMARKEVAAAIKEIGEAPAKAGTTHETSATIDAIAAAKLAWNSEADHQNQWDRLGIDEQVELAVNQALGRGTPKPAQQGDEP